MSRAEAEPHDCRDCESVILVADDNREEFELTWYESIAFDLCPLCRTPEATVLDRRKLKEIKERLMRTGQSSH